MYEESRDLLMGAIEHDAASPLAERKKARMLVGIIQTYDRRYPDAVAVLKDALALPASPEHEARLLFVLGRAYFAWGKHDEARWAMQLIIEQHAGSPIAARARDTLVALDGKKKR